MRGCNLLPMLVRCHYCNEEINPDHAGIMQRCTGWVSSTRGGNVVQPSPPTAFAHRVCLEEKRNPSQQSERLF